jgi:hypothetical protein
MRFRFLAHRSASDVLNGSYGQRASASVADRTNRESVDFTAAL